MIIQPEPGLNADASVGTGLQAWRDGRNVRWRNGQLETWGVHRYLPDSSNSIFAVPIGNAPMRYMRPSSSTGRYQCVIGSTDALYCLYPLDQNYPTATTPSAKQRWTQARISPAGMSDAGDSLPAYEAQVPIPVAWQMDEVDDVGGLIRTGVDEPPWLWTPRSFSQEIAPVAGGEAPGKAVGIAMIDHMMVLMGCDSYTPSQSPHFLTIRWCDRFNYGNWTPSDISTSGEFQLDVGTRIIGGGTTSQGVLGWTDNAVYEIEPSYDVDVVFQRRLVDAQAGLIANKAFCELDGVVYWIDQARNLRAYDGGRVIRLNNPLKNTYLEKIPADQIARLQMIPNNEYGEIQIWGGPDMKIVDGGAGCLVFSPDYGWAVYESSFSAGTYRQGATDALVCNAAGQVYAVDVDIEQYEASDSLLKPRTYWARTAAMYPDVAAAPFDTYAARRMIVDARFWGAASANPEFYEMKLHSYDWPVPGKFIEESYDAVAADTGYRDFRMNARAFGVEIGSQVSPNMMRLGLINLGLHVPTGERR